MKTKTKKKTVKKSTKAKTTTMGKLFWKMFQKADYLDVWTEDDTTEGSHESYFLSDIARIEDGEVHIYRHGSWPENQKVKLRGNTAEVLEKRQNTYKFRFYTKKSVRLA